MYKKIFFAFTSLTLAASVAAFACDKHDDNHMNNNSQYEADNASGENSSVQYVPVKDAQGHLICIPKNSNSATPFAQQSEETKILGYLQTGSVLPVPKVAYDYEEARKKELDARKKKHRPVARKSKVQKSSNVSEQTSDIKPSIQQPVNGVEENKTKAADTAIKNSIPHTAPNKAVHPDKQAGPVTTQPSNNIMSSPASALPSNEVKMPHEVEKALQNTTEHQGAVEETAAPVMSRMTALDYAEAEVEISPENQTILDQVASDLKSDVSKNIKIQSYGYSSTGNSSEARRNSFQRAIKIRKYLMEKEKEINPQRISVNALEDANNKLNRVEIMFEESK